MSKTPKLNVDEAVLKTYAGPVPRHIAVIMDGNGRWAQGRGLPRLKGHHEGANAVRRTVEGCRYLGVEALTLYAFSSQNWGRPADEVSGLMTLFDFYIKGERKRLIENGVAVRVIGDRTRLSPKLQDAVMELEEATAPDAKMVLQVAVSYGGREEILHATRQLVAEVASGKLSLEEIDSIAFEKHLYTSSVPDPDLLIRTSGELRVSNFLLWQIAYSEIFVTDAFWPDFDERGLVDALNSYGARQRRYGLTAEQLNQEAKA